jgi:hypothetical protein
MRKYICVALSVLAVAAAAPAAFAKHRHKHVSAVSDHYHSEYAGRHAKKIHKGGHGHAGYWRRGPEAGYGFGFSTYKNDPFGADDYFDGNRCHYRRHHDFCYYNKIFTGFR